MTDCAHPRIITYHDPDNGQPVPLWACADCGRRFEPLQDDTTLLRLCLDALESVNFWENTPETMTAIAALKERLNG